MLNTIKAFIADADGDGVEFDVMVTVDAGGGTHWIRRGALALSPDDEADGVVRLYGRTYLSRPGDEPRLTEWPEHKMPASKGAIAGLTESPTFIRIDRIVTLRYFDQSI